MTSPPLRILYVDDDEGLGRLMQKELGRRGCAVETVSDGVAALFRLSETQFDAMALDHEMPGQNGLETLAAIRRLADPPPVVYVTGAQDSRVAVSALKAGAADYVTKSIGGDFFDLLFAAISNAAEAVRLRRNKDAAETEVRAARDRFQALAAEREVLLREVNHRVGNSLQLVASLLHVQASASQSEEVKSALTEANGRVVAIAQVHQRLYTSQDVQTVALDQYLKALVGDLRRSADAQRVSVSVSVSNATISTDPDRAVAVGVIVTELVINAFKYAYPQGEGPVRIILDKISSRRAALRVEDDGVGQSATPSPGSTGLGRRIMAAMASKIGGNLEYAPRAIGTQATLSFDLV